MGEVRGSCLLAEGLAGEQWLMGDALLVSPVLRRGANTTDAYFPGGTVWYSFYDGTPIDATSGGTTVTLTVPAPRPHLKPKPHPNSPFLQAQFHFVTHTPLN
jgi:hypothetical protein